MKTALITIATGAKYHQYIKPLIDSANRYFVDHDTILFTDADYYDEMTIVYQKPALGYPGETLYRYHTILQAKPLLECYDQLFYIDIDMLFVAPVEGEVFSPGITATLHPGYVNEVGSPERNPDSTAMIPFNAKNKYYCGGFNGGRAANFLNMAEEIRACVDEDAKRGLVAVWHDESHLNNYLYKKPPAIVLDPSYCYPENAGAHYLNKWQAAGINPTPKILALTKEGR